MFKIEQTEVFRKWLLSLRDERAIRIISARLVRLTGGHFGDVESIDGGVSELRIDYGPGYRLYYTRRGAKIVLLLCGGNKKSQQRDIDRAKKMLKQLGEEND